MPDICPNGRYSCPNGRYSSFLCFGSVPSSLRSLPYPPGDRVHYLSLGSTGVNRGTAGSSGREAGPRGVGVPTPYPSPKTKKKTLQTGHPAEVNPFSPPPTAPLGVPATGLAPWGVCRTPACRGGCVAPDAFPIACRLHIYTHHSPRFRNPFS